MWRGGLVYNDPVDVCAKICPLSPVPDKSEITWSFPSRRRLTQENAILTVRAITTEDEGTYSCHVQGLQNYSAVLTVHGNG